MLLFPPFGRCNSHCHTILTDLSVWFPATDQWKARESLRWASEPDVHHHRNIPLRRNISKVQELKAKGFRIVARDRVRERIKIVIVSRHRAIG